MLPVLIGDTLYNHNDIVFSSRSRNKILGGDLASTPAYVDGEALAEALKDCGVQDVVGKNTRTARSAVTRNCVA